jgi:predicted aminopeptidase
VLKRISDFFKSSRTKRYAVGLVLLFVVVAVSGCHTLGFYGQALKGQYQLVAHQEEVEKLEANPQTPEALRERLRLLQEMRQFAKDSLKLPLDGHYRKYVDVHRPYVVWNVEAAPEFSMQPKTWWYPLVGSLEYRGYFSKNGATNYAAYLRSKGYDVTVGGVEAYSTLGWFKDPVLNTFIYERDGDLAEIVFHELGHQRVFARGDTDFNEAFATTVGQEGARRWLKTKGDKAGLDEYLAHLYRNERFVHLVMDARARLEGLYGDRRTANGKISATDKNQKVPSEKLRQEKKEILQNLKREYAVVKVQWGEDPEYDGWFSQPLNNAHLNAVAAYYDFVPAFEQLLAANGGDMEKFYVEAARLAKKPKDQRHATLRALAHSNLAHTVAERPRS